MNNHQTKEFDMTTSSTTSFAIRIAAGLTAAAFTLAACGGGGSSKDDAVSFFVDFAKTEGVELDKDCVVKAVDTLSDADAQTLADLDVETLATTDPKFNAAIDEVGDRVFDDCIAEG